ncbi:hypothetical protein D3C80_1382300 [compost metagenome]
MQQQGVGKRQRRRLDALAGGLRLGQAVQALLQGDGPPFADRLALRQLRALPADPPQDGVAYVLARPLGQVGHPLARGGEFVLVAQPGVERMGVAAQLAQQLFAQGVVADRHALAGERANLQDHPAPGLAALPPAVVAGVVAEAHEDRQRQAEQGEGCGFDPHEPVGMNGPDQHDEGRQQGDHQAAHGDAPGYRALQRDQHVEQIGFRTNDHGFRASLSWKWEISRRSCS